MQMCNLISSSVGPFGDGYLRGTTHVTPQMIAASFRRKLIQKKKSPYDAGLCQLLLGIASEWKTPPFGGGGGSALKKKEVQSLKK